MAAVFCLGGFKKTKFAKENPPTHCQKDGEVFLVWVAGVWRTEVVKLRRWRFCRPYTDLF